MISHFYSEGGLHEMSVGCFENSRHVLTRTFRHNYQQITLMTAKKFSDVTIRKYRYLWRRWWPRQPRTCVLRSIRTRWENKRCHHGPITRRLLPPLPHHIPTCFIRLSTTELNTKTGHSDSGTTLFWTKAKKRRIAGDFIYLCFCLQLKISRHRVPDYLNIIFKLHILVFECFNFSGLFVFKTTRNGWFFRFRLDFWV